MNITHFVENLNRGGLERVVIELVKTQVQEGHRCQLICLFAPGSLAQELGSSGVAVHACGKSAGFDFRALCCARRLMRAHATEILHTHNPVAHYYAVLASLGLPLHRVVNTRHGMGLMSRHTRRERLYRLALRRTDRIVVVCEAARRDAERQNVLPASKISVVPNGVRISDFPAASARAHDRLARILGASPQARLIGTIGRLNPIKDHANLICAFAQVRAQQPDAVLVLVGEGETRAELERQVDIAGIADHVHFLGDRNDVAELLQGLDLFVLCSTSEGYSMALLEACVAALPIVATDVGGSAEIVRDGVNGQLVPARDSDALAAAMVRLLTEPERADAMGRAGREWAQANGSLVTMSERYARIYAGLRA